MTGERPSRSRFGVGSILAFTALLLSGGCCIWPFASLKYQRYRIDSFCRSIVKGEPIGEVSRRARAQGLSVSDLRAMDPGLNSELLVSTNFLLAHLLCFVKHDGQQVESVRQNELW